MSTVPTTQRVCRGIGRATELIFERGQGSWVWTADGNKYLDFTSGIGVLSTGHCHPAVVKATQEQCAKLVHGQVSVCYHNPMLQLIEKLLPHMPGSVQAGNKLDTFFFWNSGAEAVEAAVKLARHATGKPNVICMQGAYHGRTLGSMAMTSSKYIYREKFGPVPSGFFITPFPYWRQLGLATPTSQSPEAMVDHCMQGLQLLLKQQTTAAETAAIVLEPVLGEGGYVPVPHQFLQRLREFCSHKNAFSRTCRNARCS